MLSEEIRCRAAASTRERLVLPVNINPETNTANGNNHGYRK